MSELIMRSVCQEPDLETIERLEQAKTEYYAAIDTVRKAFREALACPELEGEGERT